MKLLKEPSRTKKRWLQQLFNGLHLSCPACPLLWYVLLQTINLIYTVFTLQQSIYLSASWYLTLWNLQSHWNKPLGLLMCFRRMFPSWCAWVLSLLSCDYCLNVKNTLFSPFRQKKCLSHGQVLLRSGGLKHIITCDHCTEEAGEQKNGFTRKLQTVLTL